MDTIHSKVEPQRLLVCIHRAAEFASQQTRALPISPTEMALQSCAIRAKHDDLFAAHKHLPQHRETTTTQESLVIIRGSMRAIYYDINDSVLAETILRAGDLIITFAGGHEYIVLENDTFVYEFKNGPYNGVEKDKVFIEKNNL